LEIVVGSKTVSLHLVRRRAWWLAVQIEDKGESLQSAANTQEKHGKQNLQ
jgi:hypothetical protein